MKRMVFLFAISLMMLMACTDGGGILEAKKCWTFNIKTVARATYSGQTSTQTTYSTVTKCDLTASEAKDTAESMEGTSTTTMNGITATATITVTYSESTE